MSRLPWHVFYSANALSSDESESLQADVMRFMAILGLCLMVIFSLVQSIPQAPQPVQQPLTDAHAKQITQLRQEVTELRQDEKRVNESIQRQQKTLSEQQRKINDNQQLIRNNEALLAELQQSIAQYEEALQEALHQQAIQRGIWDKQQQEHNRQMLQDRQKRDDIKQSTAEKLNTLEKVKQQLAYKQKQLAQQDVKPIKKPVKTEQASPAQKTKHSNKTGFTLRFSSDVALQQLIKNQTVRFFVFRDRQAWQITNQGGEWRYTQASKPGHYRLMSAATVPTLFKRLFFEQTAQQSEKPQLWAVNLPVKISDDIQRLMQGRKGGELIIKKGGEVELK